MANYYDDGGAIDDTDNSGAAPVMTSPGGAAPGAIKDVEDDSTGVDQAQQQQSSGQQDQLKPNGPLANFPGNAKRIISYLMGADAAHPDTIDQIGRQIDPEGKMPAADRNLIALDQVRGSKGDNAAWQLMQANRVAYNAQTAFAKSALTGTPQKPADLKAAIDAANKAQANVLDGSNVQFSPSQGGVTAAVTMPGTSQVQQIQLSPQAFAKWLDVGGDGQWDKVMENSAPATLQKLAQIQAPQTQAQAPAGQTQPQAPQAKAPLRQAPHGEWDGRGPPQKPNFGSTPSTVDLSGGENVQPRRQTMVEGSNYGRELETRALRMFPNISQEEQRNAWMSAQEEKEAERNKSIEVAAETGKRREAVARITGQSRERAADITGQHKEAGWKFASQQKADAAKAKLQQVIAHEEAVSGRNTQTLGLRAMLGKMGTGQPLTDEENARLKQYGVAADQSLAGQTQQRPQQQPQQPAGPGKPPVQGAKLYKGQWYTRGANGESVPVQ